MSTVLGLKGTGNFDSDQRPKNYRQVIMLLYPNTKAPLTAILGFLKEEATDDPEFKNFLKGLPTQRQTVSGAQTAGDTTIELTAANAAKVFKKGHAVLNERTLEVMWVTADPSSPFTSIDVERGKGSTAAAMVDGDGLVIIGSSHAEGAAVPSAIAYDPTVSTSYTQILRTTLDMTNTAKVTRLRTGDAIVEAKREALEIHGIEMEMAFMFGTGVEDTSGAQPQRTTKGLLNVISTNVKDFADAVSEDDWDDFLEDLFEDGSSEKLLLCGNTAVNVFNKMAKAKGSIERTPESMTYGMQMQTYLTPFGTLQIKQHPLLSKNATFKDWGFALDPMQLRYRYLRTRDTKYLVNRQNPGDDATKDEYLTECGLEMMHEVTHGVIKNASTFVP